MGIDAGGDGNFQFYKSGIFKSTLCTDVINHAVLAVGYGALDASTEPSAIATTTASGEEEEEQQQQGRQGVAAAASAAATAAAWAGTQKYWILKNQWSASWGLDGYVWLAKGTNMCGVAEYCSYVLP